MILREVRDTTQMRSLCCTGDSKNLVKAFVGNFSMMDRRNHKMSLYPKKPTSTFS